MAKRKIFWLTMLTSLLTLLAACNTTSITSSPQTSPTVSATERVYVLNSATTSASGQHIIGFTPADTTATPVQLPAGLTTLAHQLIYTATPHNEQTTITETSTQTGTTVHSFPIPGNYSTAGLNYTTAVLSENGHWLALRQQGPVGNESIFALVDTQAEKLVQTIQLTGDYDLDAVSPDGSRVYLLQRLHDQAGHYYVRLYQVAQRQLFPTIIADKDEINDPRMIGSALTRQMSSDGTMAYTLYVDTAHNIAFVHILPLASQFYGARCINLPVGKSASLLHYYTLALSADGSTLYAANGALGVVVSINVTDSAAFSDQIIATAHFDAGTNTVDTTAQILHNGATLSSDQHMLYFAGTRGIWAIDTNSLKVTSRYLAQQPFTDIALSANNQTLYAVYPASGLTLVNIASGQAQQLQNSPAHAPWGFAWISN